MRLMIGIPTLSRADLLNTNHRELADSLGDDDRLVVLDNGNQAITLPMRPQIQVIRTPLNLGVAGSWNTLLRQAFVEGEYDGLVLLGDDIRWSPDRLKVARTLLAERQDVDLFLSHSCFDIIVLRPQLLQTVGFFDEQFSPAFCEDDDFAIRMTAAGRVYERFAELNPLQCSERQGTTRNLSPEPSRAAFRSKWGREWFVNHPNESFHQNNRSAIAFGGIMTKDEHRNLLAGVAKNDYFYPEDRFSGTGVVICAGGTKYLTCAYVCIRMLRHVGCQLPVEMWYLGANELNDDWRNVFVGLGVVLVDATQTAERHPARILRGWEVKAFAVINSSFRHVLLIDADNVAALDPTYLFETREYREAGAVFWPDRGRLGPGREIWSITGVPFRDEPEIESGQMLIDKLRCWKALQIVKHMNDYSDFYYRQFHGDKETFHFGWRIAGRPYAIAPPLVDVGWRAMYQHDFAGRRVFQHRSGGKWSLGENSKIPGFKHEEICFALLEELRAEFVRIRSAGMTECGRAFYRQIVEQRAYTYIRAAIDHRRMEFLATGEIGEGQKDLESNWHVSEQDGVSRLIITGTQGVIATFTTHAQKFLAGRWLKHEQCPCILDPVSKEIQKRH